MFLLFVSIGREVGCEVLVFCRLKEKINGILGVWRLVGWKTGLW